MLHGCSIILALLIERMKNEEDDNLLFKQLLYFVIGKFERKLENHLNRIAALRVNSTNAITIMIEILSVQKLILKAKGLFKKYINMKIKANNQIQSKQIGY